MRATPLKGVRTVASFAASMSVLKLFALISVAICCINAQSPGTLRLYQNGVATTTQAWSAGIVQIYYSGSWGNICADSSFTKSEADVVCRQLSYSGSSSFTNAGNSSIYGMDISSTAIENVHCSFVSPLTDSAYLTISQCSFTPSNILTSCKDNDDVIVTCNSNKIWDSPSSGDIRLTGGTYSNQGLLEIYCNSQWGTVCHYSFDSTEAEVACAQLGYNDFADFEHLSLTGTSSQPIWLDYLDSCTSSETCLTSCEACPLLANSDCAHAQDVTLQCQYDMFSSKSYTITTDSCAANDIVDDLTTGLASAVLIAIVVSSIVSCIICVLVITIPICICVCVGVGVGSAAKSATSTSTRVAQPIPLNTTAVVVSSDQTSYNNNPAAYPTQQGQQGYPPQ